MHVDAKKETQDTTR